MPLEITFRMSVRVAVPPELSIAVKTGEFVEAVVGAVGTP